MRSDWRVEKQIAREQKTDCDSAGAGRFGSGSGKVMEEGLKEAFQELNTIQRQEFKIKGEETALQIASDESGARESKTDISFNC